MAPGVGILADLTNAGISVARGNYADAALNMAAAVPIVGTVAGAGKLANRASKVLSMSSTTKKGTSVLGKYPDYIKLSDRLGAKRFNVPTEVWNKMSKAKQWTANKKFLDRMINRGDNIVLSNPVKNIGDVSGAFRKELNYLMKQGFRLSDDGTRLIK